MGNWLPIDDFCLIQSFINPQVTLTGLRGHLLFEVDKIYGE